MVEKIYIEHLTDALDVPVYAERPAEDIPDEYVVIDNTGTSKTQHIYSSTVAFQSYGKTLLEAAELNETVIAAVEQSIERNDVVRVALNSAYNFTDTTAKVYRYQAVFDIIHY